MADTCIVTGHTQGSHGSSHKNRQQVYRVQGEDSPAAGEMVQMMAVLELPPRLVCSILVSLLSLKGT